MGIGNGFLSPVDQSVYADVYSKLGFITPEEEAKLRQFDEKTLAVRGGKGGGGQCCHLV